MTEELKKGEEFVVQLLIMVKPVRTFGKIESFIMKLEIVKSNPVQIQCGQLGQKPSALLLVDLVPRPRKGHVKITSRVNLWILTLIVGLPGKVTLCKLRNVKHPIVQVNSKITIDAQEIDP